MASLPSDHLAVTVAPQLSGAQHVLGLLRILGVSRFLEAPYLSLEFWSSTNSLDFLSLAFLWRAIVLSTCWTFCLVALDGVAGGTWSLPLSWWHLEGARLNVGSRSWTLGAWGLWFWSRARECKSNAAALLALECGVGRGWGEKLDWLHL